MKVTVVTVGKAKAPFLDDEAHYTKLLRRHLDLDLVSVKSDGDLVARIPDRSWTIALDERGKSRTSHEWAEWLAERRLAAIDLCFLIGGQTGLPREFADNCRERVAFGPQTLAHQLARVVLLEQLFRAAKIEAGEPYHC